MARIITAIRCTTNIKWWAIISFTAILFCCASRYREKNTSNYLRDQNMINALFSRFIWTASWAKSNYLITFENSACTELIFYDFIRFFSCQRTNEESLKHLSEYLESVQNCRLSSAAPKHINFYVRNSGARGIGILFWATFGLAEWTLTNVFCFPDSFKLIRISLEREPNVKHFLKHILESCNLSTENVEKIKIRRQTTNSKFHSARNVYSQPNGAMYDEFRAYERNINQAKLDKTLK